MVKKLLLPLLHFSFEQLFWGEIKKSTILHSCEEVSIVLSFSNTNTKFWGSHIDADVFCRGHILHFHWSSEIAIFSSIPLLLMHISCNATNNGRKTKRVFSQCRLKTTLIYTKTNIYFNVYWSQWTLLSTLYSEANEFTKD